MPDNPFDIVICAQNGRVGYEAALLAASLRHFSPDFDGRLVVAEPQPGPLWVHDPRIGDPALRNLLLDLGAEFLPFENRHFGESYAQGNKIEALPAMAPGRPFLFLDSDTLVTGPIDRVPFDFERPSASMRREGTWPVLELYGPGYGETWRALYDRHGIPFEPTLDLAQPDEHWERYLYFNAGWFFAADAPGFAARMIAIMTGMRDRPPRGLECQPIYPWLDQIALPLAIAATGGGRPGPELDGLDGDVTHHWRILPLFYATATDAQIEALETVAAPNRIKKVLKSHEPFLRMIYQGRGTKARELFDRGDLPPTERAIRRRLKDKGFWMR